ncbi:UNVERIFIED_CONTAM: hypothetical protein GTU68_023426 [Idotea baltica]|nr:hypothetical protein [Idotea baltica]
MEMPGNVLTPTNFAQEAVNCLEGLGVEVCVRTREWAKERNMNAFLSVSKGSAEPPVFLEITYKGAEQASQKPLAIVGKGITFDSGGISLKPAAKMDLMRGDMGGAACTVGSIFTAASLRIPINIKGFIPLCENMPNGAANKPGDVILASNGKSIQIDNTDAEGRLILADALHHASQHDPRVIVDMATLTGTKSSGVISSFIISHPHYHHHSYSSLLSLSSSSSSLSLLLSLSSSFIILSSSSLNLLLSALVYFCLIITREYMWRGRVCIAFRLE